MGEVKGRRDINEALAKVDSEKVDERLAGLVGLKKIISENRQRSQLKNLKDDNFHVILEAVFRVARLEVSNLARATKYAKPRVEARLLACAAVVRITVEVALQRLRYKTVKALVEHIIQTLPTADAGYCEPLLNDYFKALATLLEYKAHPEHFLGDEWHELVDFCLETTRDLMRPADFSDSVHLNGARGLHSTGLAQDYFSRSATPSVTGDHGRKSQSHATHRNAAYPRLRECDRDLVLCLQHLTSVPNAPIFDRANVILTTLVELLHSYPKVSKIQQAALECISSIMSRVVANDIELASQVMTQMLPLIRGFWEAKDAPLKDALLILLSFGEVLLPRIIFLDNSGDNKAALVALVEVLRNDYCLRRDREQLQLDDLALYDSTCSTTLQMPLSTKTLGVRSGCFRAEHPWCLISTSAAIIVALEHDTATHEHPTRPDAGNNRTKRQRLTHPIDDIFDLTKGPDKLYALQMLVFVFDSLELEEEALQGKLETLLLCLSDDSSLITSWAMLVMNSAAYQQSACATSLKDLWLQVWRLVARHVTSTSTGRAACQLMAVLLDCGLVEYLNIADLVESMIKSVDLNGPAECDDSSTTLWTVLLVLRGREHLNTASEPFDNILRWLFGRWSPAKMQDRHHALYIAQHNSVYCTLRLICTCLGLPPPKASQQPALNLGLLSQARLRCQRDRELMRYLLLANKKPINKGHGQSLSQVEALSIKITNAKFQDLAKATSDLLVSEASVLLRDYFPSTSETSSSISVDIIRTSASFSIIGYALLSSFKVHGVRNHDQLASSLDHLKSALKQCVLHHRERQEMANGLFAIFGSCTVSIEQLIAGKDILTKGTIAMSQGFDRDFWDEILCSKELNGSDNGRIVVDLDDEFESQRSNSREDYLAVDDIHAEVPAATGTSAFHASIAARVYFMSKVEASDDGGSAIAQATSSTVDYLTSLPSQGFLLNRSFLKELFRSKNQIAEEDGNTLLQYAAQALIRPYESERSEVAMGISLEIMTYLANVWTDKEAGEIADAGAALYSWFINIALKKGISSPHVHISLSSMLHEIIKIRPEYAKSLSLQSARTCLFEVLREGNLVVKYHIGSNIADIFGLFVLKEHEHILEDVIETLPNNLVWIEGIALRLFVLARLAASWSTLLRRCVYAILECPRVAPDCEGHARNCLEYVTTELHLTEPQDLFKLFSSQILYTWLVSHPLKSIPYSIFAYTNLSDLLGDVRDEVVGQIMMRGKDDEAARLTEDLGIAFETLVERSFSKASAYSIARDVAVRPSTDSPVSRAEVRLRSSFDKEKYSTLTVENFPRILAIFFKTMDLDDPIEKGFQKHPEYSKAYSVYKQILSSTGPAKVLPLNQQPSFKARFLFDEIGFLCHRAGYDVESLWTPALYVFVYREILDGVHPALGSLHACSVLRRLRILICMAGTTAREQYPLEMALHSLEPYLTDAQCAEEAIGLSQFLLDHGSQYLEKAPSFLIGHAVSTLTSMKAFFDSTQDSTTQEREFRATMSKAQAFHAWFNNYLERYKSPHLSEEAMKCFKTIVNAASKIQTGGNARKGTYESDLLLELLEDQRSGRDLLDQPCKDRILRFLCTSFELPMDFRDDILGSDEQARRYAPVVWKMCQREFLSQNFLLWAGRVLGRAYAGQGLMDRTILHELQIDREHEMTVDQATSASSYSRSRIFQLLCDILTESQSSQVGKGEATLRSIVSRTSGTDDFVECERYLPPSLITALLWKPYRSPTAEVAAPHSTKLQEGLAFDKDLPAEQWVQGLCTALAQTAANDPLLSELALIVRSIRGFAEQAFPYILHLVLLREYGGQQTTRHIMSSACYSWFSECASGGEIALRSTQILLKAVLYLRSQPLPNEISKADRARWLELDYKEAAEAAIKCYMFKSALMFLETDYSEVLKTTRRTSGLKIQEPSNLLLTTYENIDEEDAFYGVQQPSSLASMMARLDYEQAGFKGLSFRGAYYDGQIRQFGGGRKEDEESIVRALDNLDLHGLSQSLLNTMANAGRNAIDPVLRTARKLEQWDISAPITHVSSASTIFRVFQGINSAANTSELRSTINLGIGEAMNQLGVDKGAKSSLHAILGSLATLAEADEVYSSRRSEHLYEVLGRFKDREHWMHFESFDHVKDVMSCRETIFSILSKRPKLQELLRTSPRDARAVESRSLLASSKMSRLHGALQNALTTSTYLNQLVVPCEEAGVDISAAVKFESANVLWSQGEMAASIRMLQDLQKSLGSHAQLAHIGKPELLAKLGHQISEARLEKPDEIINQYLAPAIKELHGASNGDEAGEVFHEFASFCDQQLQNPDSLEDFHRIQRLRERKESEIQDLDRMIKSASSQGKDRENLKRFRGTTKQWFDLDDREFQRLRDTRYMFLRQSLENYLLCLKACDKYDSDALRFSALWLENYNSELANSAVSKHVEQVGSRKFAPLMNQWSSRLLDVPGNFQTLLASLVLKICIDHPYHGMYQIFAMSKSKGGKDETSLARFAAANKIVQQLKAYDKRIDERWNALHNTNVHFVKFAAEKLDSPSIKQGSRVPLRQFTTGRKVEQDVTSTKVPPPTAKIELRPDCDYSKIPFIAKFDPIFTVASGVSMPKIVTAIGTDGLKYKQLLKSGNDDLRQDSIMEQVFEQVSNLLRTQRATRQRNLKIRTYKVLPLTATAGIIEFVPNTIPLHDYLLPAHQRLFPKDLKPSNARKIILDVQDKSDAKRIEQFRKVCDHFHPVLRYFFMERFETPDSWFEKRLAYTRSTAAISILGHVLGLGDRHGHNILLDEKTGEVVHIDLGIAFEQGRVLPVPEVVPFRLTRDIVDGMGITKTEGVFRRCCEFTLEALRNESYSIMMILDVLRYDPLYSWSVSPLRLKKMQDAATSEDPRLAGGGGAEGEGKEAHQEPGEADRALTVVKKKLSKSLSVQATVNELIQVATDERNLAVLFCGWAAYA